MTRTLLLRGREDDGGRLHELMDFIYLLNYRDVGATVQGVGEASSVGLRREKAIFRMESLGGTVDGHCQGKQIFSSHALTFSPEAVGLGHNFFFFLLTTAIQTV